METIEFSETDRPFRQIRPWQPRWMVHGGRQRRQPMAHSQPRETS